MKRILLAVAFALSLVPAAAHPQVDVNIHLGLPVAPPLVVVQPGVQVVEDYDEEVFYTRGWYWCRRPGGWYRARGPQAPFAYVEPRYVPATLVRMPPGHYKHWRKHEEKAERKAWKHREKEERRAFREEHRHDRGPGPHPGPFAHPAPPPPPGPGPHPGPFGHPAPGPGPGYDHEPGPGHGHH